MGVIHRKHSRAVLEKEVVTLTHPKGRINLWKAFCRRCHLHSIWHRISQLKRGRGKSIPGRRNMISMEVELWE